MKFTLAYPVCQKSRCSLVLTASMYWVGLDTCKHLLSTRVVIISKLRLTDYEAGARLKAKRPLDADVRDVQVS